MTSGGRLLAADPHGGFNSIAVLTVLIIGALLVLSLVGYVCSSAAQGRLGRGNRAPWARAGAALLAAAAICVYMWGASLVLFMEDVDKGRACEKAGAVQGREIAGYEADYLPLRFVCETHEGRRYDAVIPGYVTPVAGALIGMALISAAATSGFGAGRRPSSVNSSTRGNA
jgi:hypothetical protein